MSQTPSGDAPAFYLGRAGQQYGPYSWEDVLRLAETGHVLSDDLLWSPSWSAWTPASAIPELQGLLARAPAPARRRRRVWPFLLLAAALAAGAAALWSFLHRKPAYTLVDVATHRVEPASREQTIRYGERITVTLPPGFTEKRRTLRIGRLKEAPAFAIRSPGILSLVELTLDGGAQPPKPVEVRFAYDPKELDPAHTPREQLAAYRWDAEGGGWIALSMRVDEASRTVAVLVDHFSLVGVFRLLGKVLGYGGTAALVVSTVGEWALNDVYVTPQGNFRILYSATAIQAHGILRDAVWSRHNTDPGRAYSAAHPRYIQDVGAYLEAALSAYTRTDRGGHGLRNPAGERQGWLGKYQKSVTVKIDSYLSAVTGAPSYEKIFERLHIPTNNALAADDARVTLGHELFHVVQAEYYGVAGMTNPVNSWWLEATAEYAGHVAAWPSPLKGMDFGCGPDYLTYPVFTKGTISGPGWTSRAYQYVTSAWVKYLVDQGLGFREVFEAVASDTGPVTPERSLANFLGSRGGMDRLHRGFAAWMIFSPGGFLKGYPVATFSGDTRRDVASARSILKLGAGGRVTHGFDVANGYAAQVWAVRLQKGARAKAGARQPLLVKVNEKTPGVVVDLYVLPAGQRTLQPATPARSLFTESSSVLVRAGAGDTLCVLAGNGYSGAGGAQVVVTDAGVLLEIDPPEMTDAVAGERYAFELRAERIPKEVRKAIFEWDFGDGGEESTGTEEEAISDGEAETEIEHVFEATGKEQKHTLKVVLKSETGMTLAQAEAPVALPLGKPRVVIEPRRGTGPAGATFQFTARARPEGAYRFEWTWPGLARPVVATGRESGVAPVFTRAGEYAVAVKLLDAKGSLLSSDRATAAVEPATATPAPGLWKRVRVDHLPLEKPAADKSDRLEVEDSDGRLACRYTGYYAIGAPPEVRAEAEMSLSWTPPPASGGPGQEWRPAARADVARAWQNRPASGADLLEERRRLREGKPRVEKKPERIDLDVELFFEAGRSIEESLDRVRAHSSPFSRVKPGQPGDDKVLAFPDGDRGYRYFCFTLAAACEAGSSLQRADSRFNHCYEWVPPVPARR